MGKSDKEYLIKYLEEITGEEFKPQGIKPCPFCGSDDIYIVHSSGGMLETALGCSNCRIPEVLIQDEHWQIAKGKAINIWNRRSNTVDNG